MHSVLEAQRFTWLHHWNQTKTECRTYLILLSPSICSLHKGQNPTSTRKEENSPVQKGNDERQERALHKRPSRAADAVNLLLCHAALPVTVWTVSSIQWHWKARPAWEVDPSSSYSSKFRTRTCNSTFQSTVSLPGKGELQAEAFSQTYSPWNVTRLIRSSGPNRFCLLSHWTLSGSHWGWGWKHYWCPLGRATRCYHTSCHAHDSHHDVPPDQWLRQRTRA